LKTQVAELSFELSSKLQEIEQMKETTAKDQKFMKYKMEAQMNSMIEKLHSQQFKILDEEKSL